MPCILTAKLPEGAAELAKRVSVQPYRIDERGDPTGRSKRVFYEHALLSFNASDADFDQLPKQFEDAIAFLSEHAVDMRVLSEAAELVLDFGYQPRSYDDARVLVQSDRIPQELIRLSAALDVQIELTLYLWEDEEPEPVAA